MANKAILLMGPTAVGKTSLVLQLSNYFPIEIVSVDSALIYRDLNIGSAKPNLDELSLVPHHLIDILSPLDNYSVANFLRDCNASIREINRRGKLPVLVGGTMMYFNALINGISQLPESNPELRQILENEFDHLGNRIMHDRLALLDPISAARIAINDRQRIGRALEVYMITGKPMSDAIKDHKLPGLIDCSYLSMAILPENRSVLHKRINERFENMLKAGFIEEVIDLRQKYPFLCSDHNSMRTVGYRQVWEYLEGKITRESLSEQGMAATRQLAKRQITWLRSMDVITIDDENLDLIVLLQKVIELINHWQGVT